MYLSEIKKEVEDMPNTEGLDLLARKKPLTKEEWCELIEIRRLFIKPHLNSVTLRELGNLECLRSELSFTHMLCLDGPAITGDERFSLKTQGIFHCPWSGIQTIPNSGFRSSPGGVSCPDGKKYIWGLTGDALWILAEITFSGEAGYKSRGYERTQTVDIQESDLTTIVDATKSEPEKIWKQLGKTAKELVHFRKQLYYEALELAQEMGTEELILSLIQNRE